MKNSNLIVLFLVSISFLTFCRNNDINEKLSNKKAIEYIEKKLSSADSLTSGLMFHREEAPDTVMIESMMQFFNSLTGTQFSSDRNMFEMRFIPKEAIEEWEKWVILNKKKLRWDTKSKKVWVDEGS